MKEYQVKNATLAYVTNGKEYFKATLQNGRKKFGSYHVGDGFWLESDLHERRLEQDEVAAFQKAHDAFWAEIAAAKDQNGYFSVCHDGCLVAFRRSQGQKYDFVLTCEGYSRIFARTAVRDFHKAVKFPSETPAKEAARTEKLLDLLIARAQKVDEYLACSLKECCGSLTQSEADFLCAADGVPRFVPQNKTYGEHDLQVINVKKGFYSFHANRAVNFACSVKADGNVFNAEWRPNDKKYAAHGYPPFIASQDADPSTLVVFSDGFGRKIAIDDKLQAEIDAMAHDVIRAQNKKRVFAYAEGNSDKGCPSLLCAVSQDKKHFFKREVDDKPQDYDKWLSQDAGDIAAARVFAEFKAFCVDECGLSDANDEVIFAKEADFAKHDFAEYVEIRLGNADWAVVKFIGWDYATETAHLEHALPFDDFRKAHGGNVPEPFATLELFHSYRRLVHKDSYSRVALDRMEQFAMSHLNDIYVGDFDPSINIANVCAAFFRCDAARYLRLMDAIVDDFKTQTHAKKRRALTELLLFASDEELNDGYFACSQCDEDSRKPLLDRREYRMFKHLRSDNAQIVKSLLEEYEAKN